MTENTSGERYKQCPYCFERYAVVMGHNCERLFRSEAQIAHDFPDPEIVGKLNKIIYLLEKLLDETRLE